MATKPTKISTRAIAIAAAGSVTIGGVAVITPPPRSFNRRSCRVRAGDW